MPIVVDYTTVIRRHITGQLLQALADTPAVLVNGARQTGKITLVESAELKEQGGRYFESRTSANSATSAYQSRLLLAGRMF